MEHGLSKPLPGVNMGVLLLSECEGVELSASWKTWNLLLHLARDHGWEPEGTTHVRFQNWSGTYYANDGQWVSVEDAQSLADALQRALGTATPYRAFHEALQSCAPSRSICEQETVSAVPGEAAEGNAEGSSADESGWRILRDLFQAISGDAPPDSTGRNFLVTHQDVVRRFVAFGRLGAFQIY